MARIHLSKRSLLPALLLMSMPVTLTGCPDTEGAMDEFLGRSKEFRPNGSRFPEPVPPAGYFDASGTYLLGLAAGASPTQPLLFKAEVVVDGSDDLNPTIKVTLTPLSADDARTPASAPLETDPVPLNREDGTFVVDYGRINIDGAADTIVADAPIEAHLILMGQTNSATEICGTIGKQIYQPAELALDGFFSTTPATDNFEGIEVVTKCTE